MSLYSLGIALPGPMTGLGSLMTPPPPMTAGGVTFASGSTDTGPSASTFSADQLARWRASGLSARLMDRAPIWLDLHKPVEESAPTVSRAPEWAKITGGVVGAAAGYKIPKSILGKVVGVGAGWFLGRIGTALGWALLA